MNEYKMVGYKVLRARGLFARVIGENLNFFDAVHLVMKYHSARQSAHPAVYYIRENRPHGARAVIKEEEIDPKDQISCIATRLKCAIEASIG